MSVSKERYRKLIVDEDLGGKNKKRYAHQQLHLSALTIVNTLYKCFDSRRNKLSHGGKNNAPTGETLRSNTGNY